MARTARSLTQPETGARTAGSGRAQHWHRLANYLFLLPALVFIALTMVYPVYTNLRMSLHDVNVGTFLSGDQPWVGLANYRTLVDDPVFRKALGLSLLFTGFSLLIQFLIGFE